MSSNTALIDLENFTFADVVDSLNHPLANYLRDLLQRDKRMLLQKMIIDDSENIAEAIKSGVQVTEIFFSGNPLIVPKNFWENLPASLAKYKIAPRTCKKIFEKDKTTRIFAIAKIPSIKDLTQVFAQTKGDIVVLEELSIAGNIGAIVRTATALNAAGVILLNAAPVDIYDRRIIRSSRGYIFRLPVVSATVENFIHFCHQQQIKLLVTAANAPTSIDQCAPFHERMAILLGTEKSGCSEKLQKLADYTASIPMKADVESLNVSVAASIILYLRDYCKRNLPKKLTDN